GQNDVVSVDYRSGGTGCGIFPLGRNSKACICRSKPRCAPSQQDCLGGDFGWPRYSPAWLSRGGVASVRRTIQFFGKRSTEEGWKFIRRRAESCAPRENVEAGRQCPSSG